MLFMSNAGNINSYFIMNVTVNCRMHDAYFIKSTHLSRHTDTIIKYLVLSPFPLLVLIECRYLWADVFTERLFQLFQGFISGKRH